jgi:hypothetical protein
MLDEEWAGAGDDGDIKSEKQAAERSRGSEKDHVGEIDLRQGA